MTVSTGALSADNLLNLLVQSLPPQTTGSVVRNQYSALAILCHACMLGAGFRLVGLGEDHRIEAQSNSHDVQPLPAEWDTSSTYAFRYKHAQSSMEFLVKMTRLGGKALVYGLGMGDDKTASFEVSASDYTSEGSLAEAENEEDKKVALRNILISAGRITDFATKFQAAIIQKLAPGIGKEGYEESNTTTDTTTRPTRDAEAAPERDPTRPRDPAPARPYPYDDPLAVPRPQRPGPVPDFEPPGFENELEIGRGPRAAFPAGWTPFGSIGEQDLYPPGLGPHDPLRIGPGGSGQRGGGGMHPTFDDPIFGGGQGMGFDPSAPPGARYDPVGPGDGPPMGRLGGNRFPGGRGGGPPNPFGGFGSGDFI